MKNLKNYKIVLAEDDFTTQILSKGILSELQADVTVVENGKQLINLLKVETFDLILIDLGLPEMDGFQAILEIKKQNLSTSKIIIITGEERNEEYDLLFEQYDLPVLRKPLDPNHLLKIILDQEKQIANQNPSLSKNETLYSLEKLEELSRGKKEFVDRMVDLFKQEIPKAINQINEMLAKEDYERIRALVHRVKPSIKMMCVTSIEKEVQQLENYAGNQSDLDKIPALVNHISLVCNKVVASL